MHARIMILLASFFLVLSSGCSDKSEEGGAEKKVESKQEVKQSVKPSVNLDKTGALFSTITAKTLGKVHGKVELREDGILIHPGETPTKVTFQLKNLDPSITLVGFIATMPPETLALSNTGSVGFELFLDGKSQGHNPVDRFSNFVEQINIANAKTLTVVVDNGNGEPWADWFILGLQ